MLAVVIIITGLFIIIAILAQGATIHPTWKGPAVNEDIQTNYICQLFIFYYMCACGHRYTIFYPKSQATCVLEFRTFGIFRQALHCTQCLSLTVPLAPGWHAAQSVTFTLASGVLKTSSWSGGWLGGLTRLAHSRAHVYDLLQQKDTKQNRQR